MSDATRRDFNISASTILSLTMRGRKVSIGRIDIRGIDGQTTIRPSASQTAHGDQRKQITDTLFGRAVSGIGGFFSAPAQAVRSFAMAA